MKKALKTTQSTIDYIHCISLSFTGANQTSFFQSFTELGFSFKIFLRRNISNENPNSVKDCKTVWLAPLPPPPQPFKALFPGPLG